MGHITTTGECDTAIDDRVFRSSLNCLAKYSYSSQTEAMQMKINQCGNHSSQVVYLQTQPKLFRWTCDCIPLFKNNCVRDVTTKLSTAPRGLLSPLKSILNICFAQWVPRPPERSTKYPFPVSVQNNATMYTESRPVTG